jgi:LAO/AO transport system kinase
VPEDIAASRSAGRLSLAQYVDGVLSADRIVLARAITLVESTLPQDADIAAELLDAVLPHIGTTRRIGITGVPGVGKSTFIEALGMYVVQERGEPVAVLSVDPSSPISRGSILGDKTRMARLAAQRNAFIRPSPSGGQLGGVARSTPETILLCEAAGFPNIFIETVGVGQSETAVHRMSDFFLLLVLAGAGDELQGMKRGIMELVDAVAINKADDDNLPHAERARGAYASALHLLRPSSEDWLPPVLCCSGLENTGITDAWQAVLEHRAVLERTGRLESRRTDMDIERMHELISIGLGEAFRAHTAVGKILPTLEQDLRLRRISALGASRRALKSFSAAADRTSAT